jgi:hypothetical protein
MSDVPVPMSDMPAPPSHVVRPAGRGAFDTVVMLGLAGAVGALAYRMITLEERMQSLERRGDGDATSVFRPVPRRPTPSAYRPLSATVDDDAAVENAPTVEAIDGSDRSDASSANAAPRKRARKGKGKKASASVVPPKEGDDDEDEEAPPPSPAPGDDDVPRDA